ncbi:MAG TPA: hypothetical protein VIJ77_03005 [Candidatus Tumulicola sp.]
MMTQQLRASILSAPLAAIDRRALSQAWYSALHLARRETAPAPPSNRAAKPAIAPAGPIQTGGVAGRQFTAAAAPAPLHAVSTRARNAGAHGGADRRAPRSPLARKIERTFFGPRAGVERSTFSIGEDAARVHVMLQNRGERLRLVAICAPAHKAAVARALAQVRFALASRGIALDLDDAGAPACF